MNNQQSKGVSLYLSVIILSVLLGISLGLSSILVSKIKIIRGMEESVIAFYAADTGIEQVLMYKEDPILLNGHSDVLDLGGGDQSSYVITVTIGTPPSNYLIKSIGVYKNTKRAIEVSY